MNDLSKIKHVIVLMLENRSFDHVLGSLELEATGGRVDGVKGRRWNIDSRSVRCMNDRLTGRRARRFEDDPPHDAASVAVQMSNSEGAGMMGFVQAYEREHGAGRGHADVMKFLARADLPMTYFLADEFTICQRWFSPVPTQTIPNRLYSIAGHAAGLTDNPRAHDYVLGIEIHTLFHVMNPADWKIYAGALPLAMLVRGMRRKLLVDGNLRRLWKLAEDARNGTLPRLSWIEPVYSWANYPLLDPLFPDSNDDHPPSHTMRGQELLRYVWDALTGSPDVWKDCLFIVTYDEHGGFYDHVEPPPVHQDEAAGDGFSRRGPRVPALIVSPFAARGAVCGDGDETWDHCSILRFLCDWLGLDQAALPSPRIWSPHIRSVGDLLTDDARPDLPIAPALPARFRSVASFRESAVRPEIPAEDLELEPHDLAVVIDDLRIQVEREFPDEFAAQFPEMQKLPPIRQFARGGDAARARHGATPSRSALPREIAGPEIARVDGDMRGEDEKDEIIRQLYEKVGRLVVENDRLREELKRREP